MRIKRPNKFKKEIRESQHTPKNKLSLVFPSSDFMHTPLNEIPLDRSRRLKMSD